MDDNKKLFSSFPPINPEQWVQQAIKDLKGADFIQSLAYTTAEGITVKPFYTAEDLAGLPECRPLFTHTDWDVCETIHVTDEGAANKKALNALDNGATALHFHIHYNTDITSLLHGIGAPYIGLQFSVTGDISVFRENLQKHIAAQEWEAGQLNISIDNDFIGRVLQHGSTDNTYAEDIDTWTIQFLQTAPWKTLYINADIYHNAGAPPAYQLSCALAHAHAYINALTDAGIGPDALAERIQINLAAGPDYFFEIAKFRALRKVFALLFDTYGIKTSISIHAITAQRRLTVYDAYNNLLRTTTAAMAAVTGGCNSLSVTPFDNTFSTEHAFSRRMARNIQLTLKHESYFDKTADSAAGSWFIESLTEQIAQKAWEGFTQTEAQGGFLQCLRNGSIQQVIRAFARQEEEDFAAGKIVLVGTNKFPDPSEKMREKVTIPLIPQAENDRHQDIEPLSTTRLSAGYEQARLSEENKQA